MLYMHFNPERLPSVLDVFLGPVLTWYLTPHRFGVCIEVLRSDTEQFL